jgi:phosphate transport system protein
MALIRSVFQEELDGVSQSLVDLAAMVTESMKKATEALLAAELKVAEEVISADEKIDTYQHDLDGRIIDITSAKAQKSSPCSCTGRW